MATWVSLTDTPGAITADQFVVGNPGATALQFTPNLVRSGDAPPATLAFGTVGREIYEFNEPDATSRGNLRVFPSGATQTTIPPASAVYALQFDSTFVSNIPGGGGIGNDTGPNLVGAIGTLDLIEQGNLFATQLLFNQAIVVNAQANSGPIYTMLNQPTFRGDGGVRTGSQHNAFRIQPRIGANVAGGSFTQTSGELLFLTATADATVGVARWTSLNYLSLENVNLIAGGTIGTFNAIEISNITGPTTIRGINSAMASPGVLINATGTAVMQLNGQIQMANNVAVRFGTAGGNSVFMARTAAGVLRMSGIDGTNNERLEWDFDVAGGNTVEVTSSTAAGLQLDLPFIAFGGTSPAGGNTFVEWSRNAFTQAIAGEINNVLQSTGGLITVNQPGGNVNQTKFNAMVTALSGPGSINDATVVRIDLPPNQGTNRYGLLVTSSPSGGTLNYCARFSGAAGVRIDGIFEHTGALFGMHGVTPSAISAAYTPTNVVTDRAYDADATTLDELADVVGTLIADLQVKGAIG